MTDTANLGLPCIEGSQAQKHVTHNEALRIIDTLVQLAVNDRDLTAPPALPGEGDRFDGPWDFRHKVQTVLRPGSIVIVTPQPLGVGEPGKELTVIENDGAGG